MSDSPEAMRPIEGTLLLVDLCGSTEAQARAGSPAFQQFREPVRKALQALERATGFRLLEDQGDGFMLFRKHVANDAHDALLVLFSEMQQQAPRLSREPFTCALRYVAHFSAFQAAADADGFPRNIQSTEAVRVFRSEKLAQPGDLLITHELALRLHDWPERRGCSMETVRLDRPLKGLELLGAATTVFYRVRLPRQSDAIDLQFPALYRERRRVLGRECRTIPVFGRIFEPIDMDRNFIQLQLDPVSRRKNRYEPELLRTGRFSELFKGAREKRPTSEWTDQDSGELHESTRLSPSDLDERCRHGVILGLPGAGKTTILRFLAHRALNRNGTTPLLFAASGAATDRHAERCPYDHGTGAYTTTGALRFLLAVFLWPGDEIANFDPTILEPTTNLFRAAWDAHEATVLLDALDEAISLPLRQRLIAAAQALYVSLDHKQSVFDSAARSSRIFLTARRQFRSELQLEQCLIFDVEPLDLADLSKLARAVFDPIGKRQIADRFVAELPDQPAALRLGGTPMTALLLLFYFDVTGSWTSRYGTYDAVVRFVLLKVWERAKTQPGLTTLNEFFAAAEGADFTAKFPAAGSLYDALAFVAWHALYGEDPAPLRRLQKRDLIDFFVRWLREHPDATGRPEPLMGVAGSREEREALTWFQWLFAAALFLPDEAGQYVFIHSTVLEFLAARWLVARPDDIPAALARPNRDILETLPLLCSRDWQWAHQLLALLPQHVPNYSPESALAFACLAETEDAEARALDQYRAEAHRKPLRQRMDAPGPKDPIYRKLGEILWSESTEQILKATEAFSGLLPLKRETWPAAWTERTTTVGAKTPWSAAPTTASTTPALDGNLPLSLPEARQAFLETVLHRNLHERYIRELTRSSASDGALPRDVVPSEPSPILEPGDQDQNLDYFRRDYSTAIFRFLGSPNFRHSAEANQLDALALAVSPDGKWLAVSGAAGSVVILDSATGREVRALTGHKGYVLACAWSPDGQRLASAGADQTVRLWDPATGREVSALTGHKGYVRVCAWSPDGQRLASAGDDQTVRLWDPATGREVRALTGHHGYVRACAWSPDSHRLASAGAEKTVRLWDPATGREVRALTGHQDWVRACAWSPDGQRLASAGDDQTVRLWDPATGREVRALTGHQDWVLTCAWSPDGQRLASAGADQTVRLWDPATGREVMKIRLPAFPQSVNFHPTKPLLAVALNNGTSVLLDLTAT